MRIDFAKLREAGFDVQADSNGVEVSFTEPVSYKLIEILRSYAHTPMAQDLIVGATLDAIAKAKLIEAIS